MQWTLWKQYTYAFLSSGLAETVTRRWDVLRLNVLKRSYLWNDAEFHIIPNTYILHYCYVYIVIHKC